MTEQQPGGQQASGAKPDLGKTSTGIATERRWVIVLRR